MKLPDNWKLVIELLNDNPHNLLELREDVLVDLSLNIKSELAKREIIAINPTRTLVNTHKQIVLTPVYQIFYAYLMQRFETDVRLLVMKIVNKFKNRMRLKLCV